MGSMLEKGNLKGFFSKLLFWLPEGLCRILSKETSKGMQALLYKLDLHLLAITLALLHFPNLATFCTLPWMLSAPNSISNLSINNLYIFLCYVNYFLEILYSLVLEPKNTKILHAKTLERVRIIYFSITSQSTYWDFHIRATLSHKMPI